MSAALQYAFEIARQQSEEVQDMLAQLIFEAIGAEIRWDELLRHPKSATLLEQLGNQAYEEYVAGHTHSLDELL